MVTCLLRPIPGAKPWGGVAFPDTDTSLTSTVAGCLLRSAIILALKESRKESRRANVLLDSLVGLYHDVLDIFIQSSLSYLINYLRIWEYTQKVNAIY